MKKFHLFFTGEPAEVVKKLQDESMVEINRLPDVLGFESLAIDKTGIEETADKLEFLRGILKKTEGRDFAGKVVLTAEEEKEVVRRFPLAEVYEKFSGLAEEAEKREKIAGRIKELKTELEAVKNLEFAPSELFGLKNFSFVLCGFDRKSKYSPADIKGAAAEKTGEKGRQVFWVAVFPEKIKKKVLAEIERNKGTIMRIRRWNKKTADVIKKLDAVFENNLKAMQETEKQLREISLIKKDLFVYCDHINSILNYMKARQELSSSKFARGFSGWVKARDIKRLEDFIGRNIPEAYLYTEDPDLNEDVPIAFENRKFVEPFEVVTDLYGRPSYKNIDPTGHLSVFFAVSFAFCITDAGYGLILMLLALLLKKKFRLMPAFMKFLRLLFYGGAATFVMGAITGSWFGDALKRIPEGMLASKILNRIVVLDPLGGGNKAFIFLGWAILIGYIQILWGLILNLHNAVKLYGIKRSGEAAALLAIQVLAGFLIVIIAAGHKAGIPAYFIKIPAALLALSFIFLMVLKALEQKGAVMKVFWAFYGAYNVVAGNLLGDILSYSRLFGLGLTTAVLGLVVNEMVFMSTGIPYVGYIVAAVLFIAGHSGNLAINLLGGYVHTSRLQYLEFFTKFFEAGGRPFNPLRNSRKYTFISRQNS